MKKGAESMKIVAEIQMVGREKRREKKEDRC